jgi:hypothetical protein
MNEDQCESMGQLSGPSKAMLARKARESMGFDRRKELMNTAQQIADEVIKRGVKAHEVGLLLRDLEQLLCLG